jgi:hypothetical protein
MNGGDGAVKAQAKEILGEGLRTVHDGMATETNRGSGGRS